jgi:hypothetical protein
VDVAGILQPRVLERVQRCLLQVLMAQQVHLRRFLGQVVGVAVS